MAKKNGKSICVMCGKSKTERYMNKHRNESISEDYGFCKNCMNLYTEDNDVNAVIDALRMMNVPFVNHIWENAVDNGGNAVFSKYLQLIATQKRYKDFNNSEFDSIADDGSHSIIEVTDEIIAKWGIRDREEEYTELEYLYNSLTKIKEPATLFEEKRYVQNVNLGKAVDEALMTDIKSVAQLRKAYSEDLKDLGLDVKQSSEDDARTLGVRIAEWERNAPIPDSSDFDDVDNIKEYINKWFLIPMKRVFGRASEEEINKLYE